MKKLSTLLLINILLSCNPKQPDLKQSVEGLEILTTYRVIPAGTVAIDANKTFKIKPGNNNILIVDLEQNPIVKKGKQQPTDLRSKRSLVIELNTLDTLVSPDKLGKSKLYRQIIAMSPRYGTNPLENGEKIEIKKSGLKRWTVISELDDFQFRGEFSFVDSSCVTNKFFKLY
jgi:hypothetical protein